MIRKRLSSSREGAGLFAYFGGSDQRNMNPDTFARPFTFEDTPGMAFPFE
jgi:hypothetical protein